MRVPSHHQMRVLSRHQFSHAVGEAVVVTARRCTARTGNRSSRPAGSGVIRPSDHGLLDPSPLRRDSITTCPRRTPVSRPETPEMVSWRVTESRRSGRYLSATTDGRRRDARANANGSGIDRRRFLAGGVGTLPVAIAGCLGFGGGGDENGNDDGSDDESGARSQLEQYIDYEYWFESSGIGAVFRMNVENVTDEQLGFLVTPQVYVEDEEMEADSGGEQLPPGGSTQVTLNIFTVGDNDMEDVTHYVFDISVYRGEETLIDVEAERDDFHDRFEE